MKKGTAVTAILVIGPSWVGDMIMTQSLFITLKQRYPNVPIDVLAPDWTRPLLARMPEVRDAIAMDVGHGKLMWARRKQIGKQLQNKHYSHSFVVPNSLKSALVPYFAGIPVRTGWLKEPRYILLNDLRRLDKARYPLMIQRLNALAYSPGAELPELLPNPRLAIDEMSVETALSAFNLKRDKPVLILCPGAEFGGSKRWPEGHYADLARHFLDKNWQIWLFGSGNDQAVCDQINILCNDRCINLAGRTSLAQAIDLMSVADQVVSNDSGLMHMAAALDRPQVAVYGSTSPDFTPPLSDRSIVIREALDCSPCFKRECPLGHNNCMQQLLPGRVIQAVESSGIKAE